MINWDNIVKFVKDNGDKYIKDVFPNINPKFEPYKFSDLDVECKLGWALKNFDISVKNNNLIGDHSLFTLRGEYISYTANFPVLRRPIEDFPNIICIIMTYGKEDLV